MWSNFILYINPQTNGLKAFRGDNIIYKAAEIRVELRDNDQHITCCGVGTHHQNGVAERYVRNMVEI